MSDVESNNPRAGFGAAVDAIARLSEPASGNPSGEDEELQVATQGDESPDDAQDEASDESEQDEQEGTEETDEAEDRISDNLEEVEFGGRKIKVAPEQAAEIKAFTASIQADYTRKTQETAEIRKIVEVQHQQYASGLQVLQQFVQQTAPQPPDPRMREEDSIGYLIAQDEFNRAAHAHQQRFQAIAGEMQRLEQVRNQHFEQQEAERLSGEFKVLTDLIPAWKDDAKRSADQSLIKSTLKAKGIPDDRIAEISRSDAVAISILHEWATLKRSAEKRAAAKPVATKTVAPGPARTPTHNSERTRALNRLRQTGRRDDAVHALSLLGK